MNRLNDEDIERVNGGGGRSDIYILDEYKDFPCTKTSPDDGCRGCRCLKVTPDERFHDLCCVCHKHGFFFWV